MKKTFFSLLIFISSIQLVNAASVSVTANQNSVTSGNKVTFYVNIKDAAAWQLTGSGTGSTSGCSLGEQGTGDSGTGNNVNKTLSVTCQTTSVGQVSFSVTGNITDASMKTVNISERKIIVVTEPREKDANNNLASLSVDNYQLTPAFNADTLEYTLDVPSTIDKIKINGSASSKYATIEGLGEKEVNEGANPFEIKVTSETGITKTYKLTVNVKDENPINITIDNANYTVIKNAKNLTKPETFEETTITIENTEIPAFYNDVTKLTLFGVKDSFGNPHLVINNENKKYELYKETKSNQLILLIRKIPEELENYHKTTITIQEEKVECLKTSDTSDYALIYATNMITGETEYYLYDSKSTSYTRYNKEEILPLKEQINQYKKIITYLIIFSSIITILFLLVLIKKRKRRKIKTPSVPKKPQVKEEIPSILKEKQPTQPKKTTINEEIEKGKKAIKNNHIEDELDDTMFDILERSKKRKRTK